MRTLVIHPHDKSTHFLKPIYEKIPHKTVITGGWYNHEVVDLIMMHDRIIMLGHGSPNGLFGINFNSTYVIGENIVYLLEDKECIFIWCHADQFVKKHNLKGFHSGMFISEVDEALMYGLKGDKQLVNESNDAFAEILGEAADKPLNELHEYVTSNYSWYTGTNEIAKYNHERLALAE
jgi:hypothetical protein